jgi:hypothetical protein
MLATLNQPNSDYRMTRTPGSRCIRQTTQLRILRLDFDKPPFVMSCWSSTLVGVWRGSRRSRSARGCDVGRRLVEEENAEAVKFERVHRPGNCCTFVPDT